MKPSTISGVQCFLVQNNLVKQSAKGIVGVVFCKAWTYYIVKCDEATISLPNPLGLHCYPFEEDHKLDLMLAKLGIVPIKDFLCAKPCKGAGRFMLKRCLVLIQRNLV